MVQEHQEAGQPPAPGEQCTLYMRTSQKKPVSEVGVLDEPYSAKPAQLSSHTGPPGYIGWTRLQPM
jgi:hypothetical protein